MTERHLPLLKRITISNYSLYPGDLDFTYSFVKGINLIIGGNGTGKTTFLNLIKYAIIGLYKKGIDVKRREVRGKEFRYEKRVNLPYSYFASRMDQTVDYNNLGEVTLVYELNKTTVEVTRGLAVPGIKKVIITTAGKKRGLGGRVVSQHEYDALFSDKDKNREELKNTLQGEYEDFVGTTSNHEFFDNLIFLVNDVLFFSETRKTIMWDSEIQDKLSSKYFIDPLLDEQKEKAELEGRYQDSLGRHKSEDIRAIKKIIDSITDTDSKNKDFKRLMEEVNSNKKAADALFKDLEKKQIERERTEVQVNKLYSRKNLISKNLDDLEKQKRSEEEKIFKEIFKKVTPKYHVIRPT